MYKEPWFDDESLARINAEELKQETLVAMEYMKQRLLKDPRHALAEFREVAHGQ